jgi:hypothetical protein
VKCPNCGGTLYARYEGSTPLRFSDNKALQFDVSFCTADLDVVIFCMTCQKTADELELYLYFNDDVIAGNLDKADG